MLTTLLLLTAAQWQFTETRCDGRDNDCDGQTDETADCDDNTICTNDLCSGGTCSHAPQDALPCDDGDACSDDDTCLSGLCSGATRECSDGLACTLDACVPGACTHTPSCTGGTTCNVGGACVTPVTVTLTSTTPVSAAIGLQVRLRYPTAVLQNGPSAAFAPPWSTAPFKQVKDFGPGEVRLGVGVFQGSLSFSGTVATVTFLPKSPSAVLTAADFQLVEFSAADEQGAKIPGVSGQLAVSSP